MKDYEYLVGYRFEATDDDLGYVESMVAPTYEYAMSMAKNFHEYGAEEVIILRRKVSDWKKIHQSGFSEGIK